MSAPTTRLVWSRPATFMGIQARAAALLHIDALLGARLSLIARARR